MAAPRTMPPVHAHDALPHELGEAVLPVPGVMLLDERQVPAPSILGVSLQGCDPFEIQLAELALLPAPQAAALLASLAIPRAAQALARLDGAVTRPLLSHLPLDHVAALCAALPPGRLPALFAMLPLRRASWVRVALCSPAGSAARLLSDAFVQATPDTPAGVARSQFAVTVLVTPLADELFVVDTHGKLIGVVPWPVLETAPPNQPVGALLQPAPIVIGPDAEGPELVAALAQSGGAAPVVAETGFLLGVVQPGMVNAGHEQAVATLHPWWRCSPRRATRLLAALILATLMLAGLSQTI